MNRALLIGAGIGVLALGVALGVLVGRRSDPSGPSSAASASPATPERPVLYWYDPMVPDQHFDKAGKSPYMDMMLVPRYADEVAAGGITVDPGLRQSLGIRTATVELASRAATVRAPATLQWDLRGEARVTARVEGLIERVDVRTPFARVRRGDPLATLLAPTLASAVAEYRALGAGDTADARRLQTAAAARLRLWGLSPTDLPRTDGPPRVLLRAPRDGVLTEVIVREGDTVLPGQVLFRVNSTEALWADARVPPAQASALRVGDAAQVHLGAGQAAIAGRIEALLPAIDSATRTQTVRVVVPNAPGTLAAGGFVEVEFAATGEATRPWVPSEALILTGRASRVIVRNEDGSFRPVSVTPGRQVGEQTEILAGLDGGETVVVSGQFLIDSEASLSGLLSRLDDETTPADTQARDPSAPRPAHEHATQRRVLYWYDPMVPDKHFDQPGKSPFMDMELVPKYADEVEPDAPVERQP